MSLPLNSSETRRIGFGVIVTEQQTERSSWRLEHLVVAPSHCGIISCLCLWNQLWRVTHSDRSSFSCRLNKLWTSVALPSDKAFYSFLYLWMWQMSKCLNDSWSYVDDVCMTGGSPLHRHTMLGWRYWVILEHETSQDYTKPPSSFSFAPQPVDPLLCTALWEIIMVKNFDLEVCKLLPAHVLIDLKVVVFRGTFDPFNFLLLSTVIPLSFLVFPTGFLFGKDEVLPSHPELKQPGELKSFHSNSVSHSPVNVPSAYSHHLPNPLGQL